MNTSLRHMHYLIDFVILVAVIGAVLVITTLPAAGGLSWITHTGPIVWVE